jgi:predicted restriction endonuclease
MKIGEAILKHEERVMQLPNVMGIGIGKCAEMKVIKIFVIQKQLESNLQSNEIIPNTLEGFLTDVEEIGVKEIIKPRIDRYLFEEHLKAFRTFVEGKSTVPFVSFKSHPFTDGQEGYKYDIYRTARANLAFQDWKMSDIGSGVIIAATIKSIEFKINNLVQWQSIYGDENRPHQPLYEAKNLPEKEKIIEQCLFDLYHKSAANKSFNELINIFGKKYALIAYLFFVKDSSKYPPIASRYLDRSFELLGADLKTSMHCSWGNYSLYIGLIAELKNMLYESLSSEVTLLDAHSFAWMLSAQMESEKKLPNVIEYLNVSSTEREAIIKSRIGQGQFRQRLISYWSSCAVTGCRETRLLRVSHIKPWVKSEVTERLSLFNGLLLSPTLDACFDSGLISFDDCGNILISGKFNQKSMDALCITAGMKLTKIETEHKKYLAYHREHVFIKS